MTRIDEAPHPAGDAVAKSIRESMMTETAAEYRKRFAVGAGMSLLVRHYPARLAGKTPVLCLHGYWRNGRDFEHLAGQLAADRDVLVPDMRGRGDSDYAADPALYFFDHLVADAWALLDQHGFERAVIVGTTLGGLIALEMAAKHPERIAAMILNDIGPEKPASSVKRMTGHADAAGLTREQAIDLTRAQNEDFVSGFGDDDWERLMLRAYRQDLDGTFRRDFDTNTHPASAAQIRDRPTWWQELRAAASVPMLVLRGEKSDFLTPEIATRMVEAHPDLEVVEVRGRGHPPFLDEPEVLPAIHRLLDRVDAR